MYETMITLTGKLVSDVTMRTTSSGDKVGGFRLYCKERRFQRESATWVDGERMFVSVSCWRKLAEGVAATLANGDFVLVTGRFYLREYTTQDGQQRVSAELEAKAVGPDLARCTAMLNRPLWNAQPGAEDVGAEPAVAA